MKQSILVVTVLCLNFLSGNTAAYEVESSAAYIKSDTTYDTFSTHTFAAGVTKHFADVAVGSSPYNEAVFLNRIGGFSAGVMRIDPGAIEVNALVLAAEQWFDNVYISAGFTDFSANGFESEQVLAGELGFAPVKDSLLAIGLIDDVDDTSVNLRGKFVATTASEKFWAMQFSYLSDDDAPSLDLSVDYYVDPTLSIGMVLNRINDVELVGVQSSMFVTKSVGLSAHWQSGGNTDVIGIAGSIRF